MHVAPSGMRLTRTPVGAGSVKPGDVNQQRRDEATIGAPLPPRSPRTQTSLLHMR
jgi:hypothetical protein